MTLQELDTQENLLRDGLKTLVKDVVTNCSWERFKYILMQRMYFAMRWFTPLYDYWLNTIVALSEDYTHFNHPIEILRELISEEYPWNKPSHREDLVHDLLKVWFSPKETVHLEPTKKTIECLGEIFDLLSIQHEDHRQVIKVITILRTRAEVQAGDEFGEYAAVLKERWLNNSNSKFFFPHRHHDTKRMWLDSTDTKKTHADELSMCLIELIKDDEVLIQYCSELISKIFTIKTNFYTQFTS